MAVGAVQVTVSDDASDAMLEKHGEAYARYLDYLDNFPSDVGAVVVAEGLLCSDAGWNLIRDLETAYRKNPFVRKTISIASPSARYVQVESDTIDLNSFADTQFAAADRCSRAYNYAPFKDLLVSRNGEATAIYLVAEDHVDSLAFSQAVIAIRDQYSSEAADLGGKLLITGDPIMSSEIANVITNDMVWVLALIVLLFITTFIITRSPTTCLAAILTMLFSLVGAFGFMGWFDFEITPGTALAIFLLSPLSAAFVIHAHGYASRSTSTSMFPKEATVPTIFAGITTGTLFACTGLTPAPDVRSLALLGLVGIVFATLAIFLVVYPLLALSKNIGYSINFAIPRWALVRPWVAFLLLAVFVAEIILGFSKLRFEYEAIDYLPLSNEKRAEFEEIGQWFGRMSIPVMVEARTADDPEIWRNLNSLEEQIERDIQGTHAASFYTTLSVLTEAFTSEEPAGVMDFPKDSSFLNQLLILFNPEDYEAYIGQDGQHIVSILHVPFIGSSAYFELKEIVGDHFAQAGIEGNLVGRVSGFFESGHRIGIDNLKGLAVGSTIVFLMLVYLFKSIKLSLIGLIVNSIPVLTSLAALGLANVPIDLGSSIVTAMAFGIVVDDSTHLIIRIRRLQNAGYDPATAVVRATRELIAPIMTTTAMTCIGFCVLFAAEMKPFHDFAATIMIAMITALIADLVILPVLVRTFVKDTLLRSNS